MEYTAVTHLDQRKKADLVVVPFWKTPKGPVCAAEIGKIKALVMPPIEAQDFSGKEGEVLFLYLEKAPERRLALLGLGEEDKITTEKLRRAYGSLTKQCLPKKIAEVNVILPSLTGLSEENIIRGIAEGLLLANYVFDKYKRDARKEAPNVLIKHVSFINASKKAVELAKKYAQIYEGVRVARDLVNDNADEITPQYLAHYAQSLAKQYPKFIKTIVFDKKRIEKEKMGLLLAVNRGSALEPAFLIVEYRGNPKSKDHTVIIGKGITYDTGGLNLKPQAGMETMKCDMAGAATCLGTVLAAAKIGLKANFTAVIPTTENSIGSRSYKPGDVYTAYSGKTVEISDTDAEGRLVLADALAYTVKNLKPTRMIDFATLTGGVGVALGWEAAGLIATDDLLADALIRSSSETFERLWRLPLYEEYRGHLKSDIADIKNSGGRMASPILGATFLKEFVETIPWAHCDIAYTAYLDEAKRYQPKHATGYGVRLLIEFFENL